MLKGPIFRSIDGDLQNTVFSYIPNTAETALWTVIFSRGWLNEQKERLLDEKRFRSKIKMKQKISRKWQ